MGVVLVSCAALIRVPLVGVSMGGLRAKVVARVAVVLHWHCHCLLHGRLLCHLGREGGEGGREGGGGREGEGGWEGCGEGGGEEIQGE